MLILGTLGSKRDKLQVLRVYRDVKSQKVVRKQLCKCDVA